ncbi:MAG: hypothetical protein R3183_01955 [Oleiphilaceae bacterium]|nr:hypothetical protein [Oleiphilaceae bacterium]
MSQYELVFYGELVAGYAPEQAKQHVAQLFKASADQVERMFTGKRVVIRNKLDDETAKKYIVAMEKRGCVCVVEEMGAPGEPVNLEDKPAAASEAAAPQGVAEAPTTASSAAAPKQTQSAEPADRDNPSGLPLAGAKASEILAGKDFELAPVGERLSEQHEVAAPLFEHLDEISLAPVGTDLSDKDDVPPPPTPDTSHLKLADD